MGGGRTTSRSTGDHTADHEVTVVGGQGPRDSSRRAAVTTLRPGRQAVKRRTQAMRMFVTLVGPQDVDVTAYRPGTLREKLFGRRRLPSSHPAAAYRR